MVIVPMTTLTTPTVDTDEALAAALASLGDTPDQVAATLTEAGVTGHPGRAGSCPVANWLRTTCGHDDWNPIVDNATVDLHTDDELDLMFRAATPLAVDHFITHFDSGMWPHLEAPDDGEE
jgi:hypothetical protein